MHFRNTEFQGHHRSGPNSKNPAGRNPCSLINLHFLHIQLFYRITLFLAFFSGSLFSISEAADFFCSDEVVSIRLEAPISALKKQKVDEPDWLQGKVFLKDSEGVETVFNVQLKARGNFRRLRSTCQFPPYWLNFKKSEVKGTLFDGLDKVKMVAHCKVGGSSYEPYIHTEYLAYKTYNILTDRSFRVRLANVHYIDTDRNIDHESYDAFFIEHVDSFEDRLNAAQVKDQNVLPTRYNLNELCRAEMFQYFIGNTDFSFFLSSDECCHNSKSFSLKGDQNGLIPVPYDFDMSGLVNPPYSEPNPELPIYSVKERFYRGVGVPEEILEQTVTHYLRKKEEIYELWENADFLQPKYQAKALNYIDKFYEIFEDKKRVDRKIIADLRHIGNVEKMVQERIEKAERKSKRVLN